MKVEKRDDWEVKKDQLAEVDRPKVLSFIGWEDNFATGYYEFASDGENLWLVSEGIPQILIVQTDDGTWAPLNVIGVDLADSSAQQLPANTGNENEREVDQYGNFVDEEE